MRSDTVLLPSCIGFVETSDDARKLIQACIRGTMGVIHRRPTSPEKASLTQSGHIFIYDEKASGIRRWTDGWHWSPSRILGEFLVYGEQDTSPRPSQVMDTTQQPSRVETEIADWRQPFGKSSARLFNLQPERLVKKTISIQDTGTKWHVVSYYRLVDVLQNRLPCISGNQIFGLQQWDLQQRSVTFQSPPGGHNAGENGLLPRSSLLSISHPTEPHVSPSWSTWTESAPYHVPVNHDPAIDFEGFDCGATSWSTDDHVDPIRQEYDLHA